MKSNKGFTLIEIILYVALVAVFITSAVLFTFNIIYGKEKAYNQQVVDQSVRIAMEKIAYQIRSAKEVQITSASSMTLTNSDGNTVSISQNGQAIEISEGGLGPYNLTSNQVKIDSLNLTNLSSATSDTVNINVEIAASQSQVTASGQLTASTTLSESVELNSQFNESRKFLIDTSALSLVSTTSLQGITFQNTGDMDIAIDQVVVSWTGQSPSENLVEIQIDGGTTEWTGSQNSGNIADITDFILNPGITYNLDYIDFDSDMSGKTISVSFVMQDGSGVRADLAVTGTTGPTPSIAPTPTSQITPTPPPPASCSSECVNAGYGGGTCRKNAQDCNKSGETYLPSGNPYCTGGPNADTCCCQP